MSDSSKKNSHRIKREPVIDLTTSPENRRIRNSLRNDIESAFERFSCPICFDIWSNDISATKCGHIYCTECIEAALKVRNQCPKCNKVIKSIDLLKLFV